MLKDGRRNRKSPLKVPPIDRMVLDSAERQFPEISKECSGREGESCSLNGGFCRLYLCPKLFGEFEE